MIIYRSIVARRFRRLWRAMNDGDYRPVVDSFAASFSYTFLGDTPLGGTRRTRAGLEQWFQRLFRMFPGARFDVEDLVIEGWPGRTRFAAVLTVHATVDGEPYRNEFCQFGELRWGRLVRLRSIEDTQRMLAACSRLAAKGLPDATAPALEDPVEA